MDPSEYYIYRVFAIRRIYVIRWLSISERGVQVYL